MLRSKKVIVTSHCVLNQNTVIPEEARSPGMMESAVEWCNREGYGMIQLPCPEFTYLGLSRPPMTYEQYDTPDYREHCRAILAPYITQLRAYQAEGYEVVGGIGISHSPSCDPGRGVFYEEFHAMCRNAGVKVDYFWQIPSTDTGHFDPENPDSNFGKVTVDAEAHD